MAYKRQNWGKYSTWYPQQVIYPSSVEELQEAVRGSHSKMRVAGSLHSMNNLAETSGIQLHTDKLSQVLKIEKNRVKVQGGIQIRELLEKLRQQGLTLPNQGYIREQSIAGAIATATHGSGATGTLSSFVEEMELIDASGNLQRLSAQSDPHLFSAGVVNLGSLGVVYSLTLRCIPARKLRLKKERGWLGDTLQRLPELLRENDHFQFMTDPYSDGVLTWSFKNTEEPYRNQWQYEARRMLIKSLAVASFDLLPSPSWFVPQLFKILASVSPIDCIDDGEKLLSPTDEGHYIEQEIAVPLEKLESALHSARSVIASYSAQNIRTILLQLIRFARPDAYGYLSPALGRETAYISHISIAKEGYMDLFKDVEKALYEYEGRPHWGKAHFLTKDRVMQLYGNQYTLFRKARQQLDPEGVFSNSYMDRLFLD